MVYDITSLKSFESLPEWLRQIKTYAESNIVVLLVGNKSDLKDKREVKTEDAAAFA